MKPSLIAPPPDFVTQTPIFETFTVLAREIGQVATRRSVNDLFESGEDRNPACESSITLSTMLELSPFLNVFIVL
jgi:hypothetical protein